MKEDVKMKKNIVVVGPYLPGKSYGGPVKSIINMVETLNDYFNFYIITDDRDLNSQETYQDVEIGAWNIVGKANVFYVPKAKELKYINSILKTIDYDLVYISSFFLKNSVIIQIMKWLNFIKKPVIVAPCGEFSPAALSIKAAKKKSFIKMYKLLNIKNSLTYACTSINDRQHILNVLGDKIKIFISGNIVSNEIEDHLVRNKIVGQLKIVTLSRISKIKNIDYSLNLLKILADIDNSFSKIVFDIYGPIEDEKYWNECLAIIQKLTNKIEVNYKGSVENIDVINTLSSYHIFLLPTKGENFGHVIQEAFLSGCPVIISDQTPWSGLKELDVGFDISLTNQTAFVATIKYYLNMDDADYKLASHKAYVYGAEKVRNQLAIKEHLEMFNIEIASGK
jgi:glycosyltransferase involved in cell wall biosynthesis